VGEDFEALSGVLGFGRFRIRFLNLVVLEGEQIESFDFTRVIGK
jgi:hypothetical protein